jgi:pyruvate formate lyase activating enzyme
MEGTIFNIQRYSLDDGPGLRTTIFIKGCPLKCPWCSNPESQDPRPMVAYRYTSCKACGNCVRVCPQKAISLDGGGVHIDRSSCDRCGACVRGCVYEALRWSGESKTVEQLMKIVKRDKIYYQTSGGASPAPAARFSGSRTLWRRSSGSAGRRAYIPAPTPAASEARRPCAKIMEHTDLVYFDIKHMDASKHEEYTGVKTTRYLEFKRRAGGRNTRGHPRPAYTGA